MIEAIEKFIKHNLGTSSGFCTFMFAAWLVAMGIVVLYFVGTFIKAIIEHHKEKVRKSGNLPPYIRGPY